MSELFTLPNGLRIAHRDAAETLLQFSEIFKDRCYTRRLPPLPPQPCVIDAGANIGMFSLFVSAVRPHATVYAFEPIPDVYAVLAQNFRLHGIRGETFCSALYDREGTLAFQWYPRASVLSTCSASQTGNNRAATPIPFL